MNRVPSQALAEVHTLLQKKANPQALEELRKVDRSALSNDQLIDYCLLGAELSLLVGDYTVNYCDEAIELLRFHIDTEKFSKAKAFKGRWLIAQGRVFEAKEELLEAYTGFLRCRLPMEVAKTLNFLAFAHVQCGEIEPAVAAIEKCIVIFQEVGDTGKVAIRKMNLAYVLTLCGRTKESMHLCTSIEPTILTQGDKNACDYYINLAYVTALRYNFRTASSAINKAKTHAVGYTRETAIYHEYAGAIAILSEKYTEARKHLQAGLDISLRIAPESALVSQIKRLFGDLYIATGKFDSAHKYASEALAVAEKIGQKVEIAACYRVFAQVETKRGHADLARDWYKKALEIFSLISSRYELAVTRYLAAASDLYDQTERMAMLHLAKEYFESEDVAPYIDKVKTELARTDIKPALPKTQPLDGDCPTVVIAHDKAMTRVMELIDHLAPSDMTILLTGETGTGKDLLARYVHEHSGRTGRFIPINAAAIPIAMVESELFGCARGAFTGADKDRIGLLERADRGTVYLNEIADTSLEFQAKLLEVLETRSVRRLGETNSRAAKFRLIAATNHDLRERINRNLFRLDLYHRLNEVAVQLPPLATRPGDIPHLVRHFLSECGVLVDGNSALIDHLGAILAEQPWPGNVRELRSRVRYLCTYSDSQLDTMLQLAREDSPGDEEETLLKVLERTDWNQTRAAQILGISESAIRKRIRKHGLTRA